MTKDRGKPLLGVIREQGEWPLRTREQGAWPKIRKGAGSKENVILEQGAQQFGKWSREQQKLGSGARSKRNYQGAKRDERGAVKIGKKEQAPNNGREQGERGKMSKRAGSRDIKLEVCRFFISLKS